MAHEPGPDDEFYQAEPEEEETEEEEEDDTDSRALIAPPAPTIPERYDFPVPDHIAIIDLLAVELGEMVRVTRFLSDLAMDRNQDAHERVQTIHSIDNIVGCSGKLAEYLDRTRGNFGWQDRPQRPGLLARKR
jgi:hypothetical protein